MTTPRTGSCLCKSIQFRLNAEVINTANCHCSLCKKSTGAAFETVAVLNEADLEIIAGRDSLATYRISELSEKNFCRRCGTPIYIVHAGYPGRVMVLVGALDDPASVTPSFNLHTEKMLPWVGSLIKLKSFKQGFRK